MEEKKTPKKRGNPKHATVKKAREKDDWYISPSKIRELRPGEATIVGPCKPHAITALARSAHLSVGQRQLLVVDPKSLKTRKMFLVWIREDSE